MASETDQILAEIDAIKSVLLSHGPVFYGNNDDDAAAVAEDWYDYGFHAKGVDSWCGIGCWAAHAANEFYLANMSPRIAAKACRMYDYRQAHADSMYAVCNGDLDPAAVIGFYKAEN